MQIQVDSQPYSSIQADALVTYVFEGDNKIDGVLAEIDRRMTGGLATLVTSGEITGKALETVLLHFPEGMDAKRLLLVGAGKPGKFVVGDLRKIAGAALRYLKSRGVKNFAFLTREGERSPAAAQAITEGLLVADFESDKYRSEKKNNKEIQSVSLAGFEQWFALRNQRGDRAWARYRRIAEFRARSHQRTFQPPYAAHACCQGRGDGQGSWPGR